MKLTTPKLSLNASGAACWSLCTAQPHYVQANAHRLPPQDTEFSAEGVVAHKVVEYLFKGTSFKIGNEVYERGKLVGTINGEMLVYAQGFVNYCKPFESDWSYSEQHVSLFYKDDGNGFVDWCSFHPDAIDVADFKYGQGVAVSAVENLQMAIYTRSLVKDKKIPVTNDTKVRMHIYQPRVRRGEKISVWEITWGELVQFTDDRVQGPADTILKGTKRTFYPSEKTCQFCAMKKVCGIKGYEPDFEYEGKTRAQWLTEDTPLESLLKGEKPVLAPIEQHPDEVIAKIISFSSEITSWLKGFEKYGLQLAASGRALPGTKVVLGKGGHRVWSDPEEAKLAFRDLVNEGKVSKEQVFKETLVTPKQAEEFEFDFTPERWAEIKALMYKPKGKPVLAPLDDPRPEYTSALADGLFDEEEDEV